jgi:MFS transporter, DHA1 family, multidrug resistance protein
MASLVTVTGVGPLGTDTYLAALPAVARSLHTTTAVAQLSITVFIVGSAFGQIVIGPVSDGRGRRPVLLAATVAFTAATAASALAWSGPILLIVRTLQGIAAGVAAAVGRAVVSDVWHGVRAAQRFGTLTSITLLAPVVAPAAGGLILAFGSWRTVFAALTLFGVLMIAAAAFGIPETLSEARRGKAGAAATVRRMADLLTDRVFMAHVVVQCLATGGFFVYIGGSSFVLQHVFGISELAFTVLFATNAAAMAATTFLFRLTVAKVGPAGLRTIGLSVAAACAAALVVEALVLPRDHGFVVTWILLGGVVASMGLAIPATTTLAQGAGLRAAGTASSLQGGLVFLAGAATTPLTGVFGDDTLLPMALLMALFLVLARVVLTQVTVRLPRP